MADAQFQETAEGGAGKELSQMAGTHDIGEAISQVREELDRVRQVRKCAGCECLLDALKAVQTDLAGVGSPEAEAAKMDFQGWFEAGSAKRHRCLGCEVCLPTDPYNRFSAFLRDANIQQGDFPIGDAIQAAACSCGDT